MNMRFRRSLVTAVAVAMVMGGLALGLPETERWKWFMIVPTAAVLTFVMDFFWLSRNDH